MCWASCDVRSSAVLLLPACLRFSPLAPPPPGVRAVPCAVCCRLAVLPFRLVFCGAVLPCSVLREALSRLALLWAAPRWSCCLAALVALCFAVWFFCVLRSAVSLGAVLRRVAPPCVVLLCAVWFSFAHLVPLPAVSCPRALFVALGSCTVRRCVWWCFPALSALCCVFVAVVCLCVLLFAAVLCAVVVLGCLAVRFLSSRSGRCGAALCWCACVVLFVWSGTVSGTQCFGALLCVLLLPVVCCGTVLGPAVRGRLLVAGLGVGVPVWPRGLLPCGS